MIFKEEWRDSPLKKQDACMNFQEKSVVKRKCLPKRESEKPIQVRMGALCSACYARRSPLGKVNKLNFDIIFLFGKF